MSNTREQQVQRLLKLCSEYRGALWLAATYIQSKVPGEDGRQVACHLFEVAKGGASGKASDAGTRKTVQSIDRPHHEG